MYFPKLDGWTPLNSQHIGGRGGMNLLILQFWVRQFSAHFTHLGVKVQLVELWWNFWHRQHCPNFLCLRASIWISKSLIRFNFNSLSLFNSSFLMKIKRMGRWCLSILCYFNWLVWLKSILLFSTAVFILSISKSTLDNGFEGAFIHGFASIEFDIFLG